MLQAQYVTSSQLLLNFTIDQLLNWPITILSVFNDKLLVSGTEFSQLFIYSLEGHYCSTVSTIDNNKPDDASWTPRGNIVYTSWTEKKLVVMSEAGNFITEHTQMTGQQQYISVCDDDFIYLIDVGSGVYQSTDDGISWSLALKSDDRWSFKQVIKMTTAHSDDFLTLGTLDGDNYQLRLYNVNQTLSGIEMTWRDINTMTTDGKHIDLFSSSLSYDGSMNIFLSDSDTKIIYVTSVYGEYHYQLLLLQHVKNKPFKIAVNTKRQLLYVGQYGRLVEVFKLTYYTV